jgi:ABC-type amino acid transport substrate-binding protein
MPDKSEEAVLYAAVYNDVDSALADLEAFEQLQKAKVIGKYDAAVIDKEEGKPHIVKRADHPRVQIIAEWFGAGKLPRSELRDAAQALEAGQAELVVIGEPTLQKGFEQAVTKAANTIRLELNTTTDELAEQLIAASKETSSMRASGQA